MKDDVDTWIRDKENGIGDPSIPTPSRMNMNSSSIHITTMPSSQRRDFE